MEKMSRRGFGGLAAKGALVLAALSSGVELAGCSWTSIYTAIQKYVPLGLQAFAAVAALLTGQGVISGAGSAAINAVVTLVNNGFAGISAAVQQYETATAGQKPTLLAGISTALTVAANDIQDFWTSLNIPNPNLAATVKGLLGIITTTLSGFLTQLPVPVSVSLKQSAKGLSTVGHRRSPGQFKADFNAILTQNGFSKYIIK